MAEGGEDLFSKSLQKLDDELTCPLCTQHFREPKVLPCLHYYCKACIADLIKSAKGRPFNCPECRREAQTAGNDPESFPTAFFVNRMEEVFSVMKKAEPKETIECEECSSFPAVNFCHDCSEYICTKCSEAHKSMRHFSSHKVVSINSLRSTISKSTPEKLQVVGGEVKCTKHTDEPLKLYCHDCHKLVCRDCIVIDHKDHRYAFVVDAAPVCKEEMRERSESVKNIFDDLKAAVKSLEDSKNKLSDHETATTRAIDDTIDRISAKLMQKKAEMKANASQVVSEAKEKVSVQEKNVELAMGEVESLLEFMSRSLETATDQELLSLEKQMSNQVDRVSSLYKDPAGKFSVPELPELVVQCGPGVEHVIQTEISVVKKEEPKVNAKLPLQMYVPSPPPSPSPPRTSEPYSPTEPPPRLSLYTEPPPRLSLYTEPPPLSYLRKKEKKRQLTSFLLQRRERALECSPRNISRLRNTSPLQSRISLEPTRSDASDEDVHYTLEDDLSLERSRTLSD